MQISVIIPAYNEEKNLAPCLDSILMQGVPGLEVLVVDDGSRDGTQALARQYARQFSQVRVLAHPRNRGLGAARNTGIRSARGEYLLFVDGDDLLMPGSLARVREALQGDLVLLTSCKQRDGKMTGPFRLFDPQDFAGDTDAVLYRLADREIFFGSACDKAVRRAFVQQHRLLFPENRLKETIPWCVQLLLTVQSVRFCNAAYYCYRQRGRHSLSGQISRRSLEDVLTSVEECVQQIGSSDAGPLRRKACYRFLAAPFLFAGKYMADLGTPALESRLQACAWLLDQAPTAQNARVRRVIHDLGMHTGVLYLRAQSKANYQKGRKP